jgi:hypothetical protein
MLVADVDAGQLLGGIAETFENLATAVDRHAGAVAAAQEHGPYHQSPEQVCATLAQAQSAAAVGMALSCPFAANPVCAFFSGLYAGITISMWYHGC